MLCESLEKLKWKESFFCGSSQNFKLQQQYANVQNVASQSQYNNVPLVQTLQKKQQKQDTSGSYQEVRDCERHGDEVADLRHNHISNGLKMKLLDYGHCSSCASKNSVFICSFE